MSKRWVPYKHSSGMAIYLHQNITQGHEFVGGEFMVSSTVRGSPQQCLAALTHSSSSTSILGPAAAVQVLSRNGDAQVSDEGDPEISVGNIASAQCLAALTHSSSATSILGPAAAVQVLSRDGDAQVSDEGDWGIRVGYVASAQSASTEVV